MDELTIILLLIISFLFGYLYRLWSEQNEECPTCRGEGYIKKKIKA